MTDRWPRLMSQEEGEDKIPNAKDDSARGEVTSEEQVLEGEGCSRGASRVFESRTNEVNRI